MMKPLATILLVAATFAGAQTPAAPTPAQPDVQAPADTNPPPATLTMRSNLVVVPALVRTKAGQLVYTLKANDFILTDDGVVQKLRLEQDTGSQPLAMVIIVQTGGDAAVHLDQYQHMDGMLTNMLGGIDHRVAVVGFDSTPVLLHGFTPNLDYITHSLDTLDPGDKGAAVFDAIVYAVNELRQQPTTYRRAILLLSQTTDNGSHTPLVDALHAISDTNTVIYSVGFHTTGTDEGKEANKFGWAGSPPLPPGPKHGCFSRDMGTDAQGNQIKPTESAGSQDLNCAEELLPPLRLAHLAEIAVQHALKKNISESVAHLTGGEYFKFKNEKTLDRDLFTIANHIPNRYVLTFVPTSPTPGFHYISLKLRDPATKMSVDARNGYWVNADEGTTPTQP
ncbi:MAG: VWA domain-containing protein [Acidobacteriaceae bacterium]